MALIGTEFMGLRDFTHSGCNVCKGESVGSVVRRSDEVAGEPGIPTSPA